MKGTTVKQIYLSTVYQLVENRLEFVVLPCAFPSAKFLPPQWHSSDVFGPLLCINATLSFSVLIKNTVNLYKYGMPT